MNLRLEQKQKTRRALIDAALKLSAQEGLAAISLRVVAKEGGITPAAFYRHFHDMEELGLALIDEIGLALRQLLREARKNFDGKGGIVRKSVEVFIRYVTENSNLFRVLLGERQGSSSAFRKSLYAEIGRFIDDLATDLENASASRNAPYRDPALAAEAIVAVSFTVGAEALDLPKHKRAELGERLIRLIQMILRGAHTESAVAKKAFLNRG